MESTIVKSVRTEAELMERISVWGRKMQECRINHDGRTNHFSHTDFCYIYANHLAEVLYALGNTEQQAWDIVQKFYWKTGSSN